MTDKIENIRNVNLQTHWVDRDGNVYRNWWGGRLYRWLFCIRRSDELTLLVERIKEIAEGQGLNNNLYESFQCIADRIDHAREKWASACFGLFRLMRWQQASLPLAFRFHLNELGESAIGEVGNLQWGERDWGYAIDRTDWQVKFCIKKGEETEYHSLNLDPNWGEIADHQLLIQGATLLKSKFPLRWQIAQTPSELSEALRELQGKGPGPIVYLHEGKILIKVLTHLGYEDFTYGEIEQADQLVKAWTQEQTDLIRNFPDEYKHALTQIEQEGGAVEVDANGVRILYQGRIFATLDNYYDSEKIEPFLERTAASLQLSKQQKKPRGLFARTILGKRPVHIEASEHNPLRYHLIMNIRGDEIEDWGHVELFELAKAAAEQEVDTVYRPTLAWVTQLVSEPEQVEGLEQIDINDLQTMWNTTFSPAAGGTIQDILERVKGPWPGGFSDGAPFFDSAREIPSSERVYAKARLWIQEIVMRLKALDPERQRMQLQQINLIPARYCRTGFVNNIYSVLHSIRQAEGDGMEFREADAERWEALVRQWVDEYKLLIIDQLVARTDDPQNVHLRSAVVRALTDGGVQLPDNEDDEMHADPHWGGHIGNEIADRNGKKRPLTTELVLELYLELFQPHILVTFLHDRIKSVLNHQVQQLPGVQGPGEGNLHWWSDCEFGTQITRRAVYAMLEHLGAIELDDEQEKAKKCTIM